MQPKFLKLIFMLVGLCIPSFASAQEFSVNPNTANISIGPKCSNCAYSGFLYQASIGMELVNSTKQTLDAGVVSHSVVIGNCSGENYNTRGLVPFENPSSAKDFDWVSFSSNMSIFFQTFLNERCLEQFFTQEEARISLTLWVRLNGTIKRVPIQIGNVPIVFKKK